MNNWLLLPPVAFTLLFFTVVIVYVLLGKLSLKGAKQTSGKFKQYACGEDIPVTLAQPDYGQFFPFALFFTIMHVVALLLATVPHGAVSTYGIAVVYMLGAIAGLIILFRR